MIDLKTIDELTRKLSAALPPGVGEFSRDVEAQFKAIIAQGLERLDVVSREEFDAQKAALERAEAKLAELEARLGELAASSSS